MKTFIAGLAAGILIGTPIAMGGQPTPSSPSGLTLIRQGREISFQPARTRIPGTDISLFLTYADGHVAETTGNFWNADPAVRLVNVTIRMRDWGPAKPAAQKP